MWILQNMLYTAGLRMVLLVHVLPSSQMNTMMILKELVESGTYSPARLLKVPISGMRTQITPDHHKRAQCLSYPPKSEVKYYNAYLYLNWYLQQQWAAYKQKCLIQRFRLPIEKCDVSACWYIHLCYSLVCQKGLEKCCDDRKWRERIPTYGYPWVSGN